LRRRALSKAKIRCEGHVAVSTQLARKQAVRESTQKA